MASATIKSKVKPQLDGKVISNDGDIAIVQYKDGESRAVERFLGQEEWKAGDKVVREAEPAETREQFLKEMSVGQRVTHPDQRPPMLYGTNVSGPNCTARKMTVGDLIHELQAFPPDSLALISIDEEGNDYKYLYNVIAGTFGEDGDDLTDERFEGYGLKVGHPYVIIWPHG